MLLFLTNRNYEVIADWLGFECQRRGISYLCLCLEQFPQDIVIDLQPSEYRLAGHLYTPEKELSLTEITAVWEFVAGQSQPDPELDPAYKEYAIDQAEETMRGLWLALQACRWINPPHHAREAWHKPYQLRLAQRLGLAIPRTIITNNPQDAVTFLHDCAGQIVYKPVSYLQLSEQDQDTIQQFHVYATLINHTDLMEQLDTIRLAPCLFQEYIEAVHDVTAYVIGSHVWAASIDGRVKKQAGEIDYRRLGTWELPYQPELLPPALEQKLVQMTQQMGLRMCNYDLLLTPAGEYVFLDANPTDLWPKIEEIVGFPLRTAVIDELLGVDTLTDHPYLRERSLQFDPSPIA